MGEAERGDRNPDGEAERCDFTSISARLHEKGMRDGEGEGVETSLLKMATGCFGGARWLSRFYER